MRVKGGERSRGERRGSGESEECTVTVLCCTAGSIQCHI